MLFKNTMIRKKQTSLRNFIRNPLVKWIGFIAALVTLLTFAVFLGSNISELFNRKYSEKETRLLIAKSIIDYSERNYRRAEKRFRKIIMKNSQTFPVSGQKRMKGSF